MTAERRNGKAWKRHPGLAVPPERGAEVRILKTGQVGKVIARLSKGEARHFGQRYVVTVDLGGANSIVVPVKGLGGVSRSTD